MDVRPAEFVRWVGPDESEDDLVDEAKDLTWSFEAEHALVTLATGLRAFIKGGRDGIEFGVVEHEGSWSLEMESGNGSVRVSRIEWHTHPIATGPSDGDREALRILGQTESRIFEIGGDRHGTTFGPGKGTPGH